MIESTPPSSAPNTPRHDSKSRARNRGVGAPARVARAAGRGISSRDLNLDVLEQRQMLAVDHPSLPTPWTPNPASTLLSPDTVNPDNIPLRGRAEANGTISSGDPGDLFRFTVPATGGRTKDFVTVLADTTGAMSTLDTFVEVFSDQGVLIASGGTNGNLSVGLDSTRPVLQRTPDGWVGFEGTVGSTYYIRVRAEAAPIAGRTSTGNYVVKIDAASVQVDVNQDPDVQIMGQNVPNIDFGRAFTQDTLTSLQEDIIYRVTTPADARFDSLASFLAIADDNTMLNPHLDLYSTGDAQGRVQRLAGDTDAGRQTDSFFTSKTAQSTTYYLRIRSDDLRTTPGAQAAGTFQLVARFAASDIPIDDVIRQGVTGQVITAGDDPAMPPSSPWTNVPLRGFNMNRPGTDAQLFKFTAQGTGLAIVTVVAQGAARPADMMQVGGLPQPALRFYDSDGNSIDFNKGDNSAELQIPVVGGKTYFLVVEGFDNAANGGFRVFIEAHHTNDPAIPVDDHINNPGNNSLYQWEQATPLRFGDPFKTTEFTEQNDERDSYWKQTAVGRGRLQGPGDNDLFQFTAPVDQLSNYVGEDGNQPNPIYVGGNFQTAGTDPRTGVQYDSPNVGLFDAGRWFPAGLPAALGPSFSGQIFAMAIWDIDGAGTLPPVLAVGGQFAAVNGQQAGNLAFRVFDAQTGGYVWSTDPLTPTSDTPIRTNGPVFSLAAGDVRPAIIQSDVAAAELYFGGSFTQFIVGNTPTAVSNIAGLSLGFGVDNMNGGVTGNGPGNAVGSTTAVLAMTIFDPPAQAAFQLPPNPPATASTAPVAPGDPPATLYFGGRFLNGSNVSRPTQLNPGATQATQTVAPATIALNNLGSYRVDPITRLTPPVMITEGLANRFTNTGGNPQAMPATLGSSAPSGFGITGEVRALTSWDSVGSETRTTNPDGTLSEVEIPRRLVIGGRITQAGTGGANPIAVTNVVAYDVTRNADIAAGQNTSRFVNIGAVANPVNALATWLVPQLAVDAGIAADVNQEILLSGGEGAAANEGLLLAKVDTDGANTAPFLGFVQTDAVIRTVTVFNPQAPGYPQGVDANGLPVLIDTIYIGGDFTNVNGTDNIFGVSRLRVDLTAQNPFVWEALGSGVQGVSQGQTAPTRVNVILPFNDNVALRWDRLERAASRVSIVLSKPADARFNAQIRVFDSRFNLIYDFNDTLDPTGQSDNPGSNDPSNLPAFQASGADPFWRQTSPPFPGFTVWAGEVYYIEVSAVLNQGTGRYTFSVTTDALPPQIPQLENSGIYPDFSSTWVYPVGQGQFADAPEIPLDDGKGRAIRDPLDENNPSSYLQRIYPRTAAGISRTEFSGTPVISRVQDTHLFQFRAVNTGTAEIRLSTFGITRVYQERVTDSTTGTVTPRLLAKQINSPLQGALRVFNNDFVQLGFSNGNQAVGGLQDAYQVQRNDPNATPPDDGVRVFDHEDPRLVINVQRGNVYFIQVESAHLGAFLNNPDLVDWRFATGAYDLLINATPSLSGIDDHYPNSIFQQEIDGFSGTVFPVNPVTGAGTISGEIRNIVGGPIPNPQDADTFIYTAEGRGQVTLRLTPTSPLLAGRVRVFDDQGIVIATSAGGAGVATTVQFNAQQGDRFFFVVDAATTQGTYTLSLTSPIQADDHPLSDAEFNDIGFPLYGWSTAQPLELNRFLGLYGLPGSVGGPIESARGSIENPTDLDMYKFTAEAYEIASVSVTKIDATLNPFVRVYEISADGAGNPVFLKIAENDDINGTNNNSSVSFSVTPGRDYYVLVEGFDFDADFGRYTVAVNVAPTDDHPNRIDFPLGTTINLNFDNLNFTSTGGLSGTIGLSTDDDLFRFTAPATGSATVTLARGTGSTLGLDLLVLDANNTAVPGVTFTPTATTIVANLPSIVQGTQYFLLVRAANPLPGGATDTGAYTVSISTLPSDDFPNAGQFNLASTIPIVNNTGVGTQAGLLVPAGDTDLFKFSSLAQGSITVRITTPNSTLNPKVTIFSSSQTQLITTNGNGDTAQVVFNAAGAAEQFFILVSAADGASGATAVGGYTVNIIATLPGGGGGGPGPDDFPNAGEFNDAPTVSLDGRTGTGNVDARINFAGDSDLFRFVAAADGQVDIQLITPAGGLVDGQLKIYNAARSLIFQDAAGLPGASASVRFSANAGDSFFVLVEPIGASTGSYSVRIDTQPLVNFLYFPDGFAGATIDEFVPLVNTNSVPVTYEIFARYETGSNPTTPIASGTLAPNSRGGVTISTRNNQAGSLVRIGVPYALEIRSSKQIGATFSHYDFSASIGESFTDRTSTTWTFAEGNKDRNAYRDFLLFYNPGSVQANVQITLYYSDGQTLMFSQTIDSLRRSGINFDADSRVSRSGKFGIKVTSDQPIVSSLSSYRVGTAKGGDGLLGDADGGSVRGVVPNVSAGAGVEGTFSILNTNSAPATVTFTANYGRIDIPNLVRVLTIPAGTNRNFNLSTLGLLAGQTAGLTYSSTLPVTFQAWQYQRGDGNTTTTATSASREYVFGDLFVDPQQAGIKYIEQLGLYNPTGVNQTVSVKFLFTDGTSSTSIFTVNAGSFQFVQIDQQAAILSKLVPTAFSLQVTASSPIVAGLTHYDLFLNGGWSAIGAPVGLTNPISTIA